MKYYKIIKDSNFIGIACSTDFVRYQQRNHCFVSADELTGEFVECNGLLYRSAWMPPVPNELIRPFEQVIILEITKAEYDIFNEAIEKQEEIIIEDNDIEPIIINPPIDENQEISIDFIRSSKISEMSAACRATIEAGFDLELRGEVHHFSLDTQDQLNLITLSAMAQTEEVIPYHADGEACIFYTAYEINQIVAAATQFKIYHTTYHNALKGYINALKTIEEISAITYGTEIPEEYKSDVLKALEA